MSDHDDNDTNNSIKKEKKRKQAKTVAPGRVAVITGANRGCGYAGAIQLAQSNKFKHVVLACRSDIFGKEAQKEIQEQSPEGVEVHYLKMDLLDRKSRKKFSRKMESTFGRIDVLVNNAAIAYRTGSKDETNTPFVQQCNVTLNTNFRGPLDLTERLLPLIRHGTQDPRIVFVSSILGRVDLVSVETQKKLLDRSLQVEGLCKMVDKFEHYVEKGTYKKKGWPKNNYAVSKLALHILSKILSRQERQNGISINSTCPGYCKTRLTGWEGHLTPEQGARNMLVPALEINPPSGEFYSAGLISNTVTMMSDE